MHEAAKNSEGNQFDQIGGLLIIVAIGLFYFPVQLFFDIYIGLRYGRPGLLSTAWHILSTSEFYQSSLLPLLIFEVLFHILFFVLNMIAIIYFFSKKRIFPTIMITLLISNLIFLSVDSFLGELILDLPISENQSRGIGVAIIQCIIWIPYFMVSSRVKGTFVH